MALPELILASQSPRRKALLGQAGLRFRIHVPATAELAAPTHTKKTSPAEIVQRIALEKARASARELASATDTIILSADTLVFLGKKILGKPETEEQARAMLRSLSGKWHTVYTGVTCLVIDSRGRHAERSISVATKVRFFPLQKSEIDWYVSTKEPMDKAGAYGAQGFGSVLIKAYSGSYTNVVGLPLGETLALLERAARRPWQDWQDPALLKGAQ